MASKPNNEQGRIVFASAIIATFLAFAPLRSVLENIASATIINLALALLIVSSFLAFIHLLLQGVTMKYKNNDKLPFLTAMSVDHVMAINTLKEKCFDMSVNIFFFIPILVISSLLFYDNTLFKINEWKVADPESVKYTVSIIFAYLFWTIIVSVIHLVVLVIEMIESIFFLKMTLSVLALLFISQVVFISQEGKSLSDINFGFIITITILVSVTSLGVQLYAHFFSSDDK